MYNLEKTRYRTDFDKKRRLLLALAYLDLFRPKVFSSCRIKYETCIEIKTTYKFMLFVAYQNKYSDSSGWGAHSKNSRVRFDPEKSPRGPDPFWGQTYPESRSD